MSSHNFFESPFKGKFLKDQITNPNIKVGRYSYYSGYYHGHSFDDCVRYLMPDKDVDKLIIGSFCSIGSGASFIMAGNQGHRIDWISSFPFYYFDEAYTKNAADGFQRAGDTEIGHDVWIGSEAMVMPGVKIGDGAVVGARAIVTKNVPPYSIIAGNPAKVIRSRFADKQISQLLEMQWWSWNEEKLAKAMTFLCSIDIEGLYHYWRSL